MSTCSRCKFGLATPCCSTRTVLMSLLAPLFIWALRGTNHGVSQLFHRSCSKATAARTVYVLTRSTSQKAKIGLHLGPQHENDGIRHLPIIHFHWPFAKTEHTTWCRHHAKRQRYRDCQLRIFNSSFLCCSRLLCLWILDCLLGPCSWLFHLVL